MKSVFCGGVYAAKNTLRGAEWNLLLKKVGRSGCCGQPFKYVLLLVLILLVLFVLLILLVRLLLLVLILIAVLVLVFAVLHGAHLLSVPFVLRLVWPRACRICTLWAKNSVQIRQKSIDSPRPE